MCANLRLWRTPEMLLAYLRCEVYIECTLAPPLFGAQFADRTFLEFISNSTLISSFDMGHMCRQENILRKRVRHPYTLYGCAFASGCFFLVFKACLCYVLTYLFIHSLYFSLASLLICNHFLKFEGSFLTINCKAFSLCWR